MKHNRLLGSLAVCSLLLVFTVTLLGASLAGGIALAQGHAPAGEASVQATVRMGFSDNSAGSTVAFGPARSQAVTRYVSPTGIDSGGNDCSNSSNPCRTIQHAIDMAADGDIIQMAAGQYAANVFLYTELTFNGAGMGKTILDGGGSDRVMKVDLGNTVYLNNLTIRNGHAPGANAGGGIANYGKLNLEGVEVTANTAGADGGGGIYSESSQTLTIKNSWVHGNTASSIGGGLFNRDGPVIVENSLISSNTAQGLGDGGGLYNSGMISMTNVTMSDNRAGQAGSAIYNTGSGTVSLLNATIAGNRSDGIFNYSTVVFKNTLVANNDSVQCHGSGTFTSLGHNLESGNTCNFNQTGDQVSANPQLLPLGNYGGPTPTYNMNAHSPAIDGGTNSGCPAMDQRGYTRPVDGDSNGSSICDIGAIEFDPTKDGKVYIFLPFIIR